MRIALCQIPTETDNIPKNLNNIIKCLGNKAEVYVFPEMFLTGYFSKKDDPEGVRDAVEKLRVLAAENDICIVVGGPEYTPEGKYNAAYVITDTVRTYRKIHLPSFGPFTEKGRFIPGKEPMTFEFKDMKFGLCICYDAFFPEQIKASAVEGSEVNIVISASPVTSREAFECILPARALENNGYVVFVNNIGTYDGMEFFAGSRAIEPDLNQILLSETEGVAIMYFDPREIEDARKTRPCVADTVGKYDWN